VRGSPQVTTWRAGHARHQASEVSLALRRASVSSSSSNCSNTICKAEGTKTCAAKGTTGAAGPSLGWGGTKAPQARRSR